MALPVEAQHTEVVMSLHEHETTEVECPRCHGSQVEQPLSTFIAKTSNRCRSFLR